MFFINLIITIIGVALGCYILFAGRKHLWATLGIVALSAVGNLLAVLVADLESARELIAAQEWLLVGITVAAGALGVALGHYRPDLAVWFVGFIAGADAAIWLYDISTHIIVTVASSSETLALWTGIAIIVIGGLLGLWLVRTVRDEALIFITMIVGTRLLQDALGLSRTSSWTAIIMLSFALAGVLVQYAIYLREVKSEQLEPEQHESSMAYFQDLELH